MHNSLLVLRRLTVAAVVLFALSPASAQAEDGAPLGELELAVDLGFLDRGTTGVGAPLLDLGYDSGGGPVAGLGARFYFHARNRYFRHGINLRLSHTAGMSFGALSGVGFAWTAVDATYAFRTLLPCMSEEDSQWMLTAMIGLTGARADAGTGTHDDPQTRNNRARASHDLDHLALGGMLAVDLSWHGSTFLAGVTLDVREYFGLGDTDQARSFVTTAAVRGGVHFGL